jgi:hypothetical protein
MKELLAAVELLKVCGVILRNNVFMLHFDNINAAGISEKGLSKFWLKIYANIFYLCRQDNFKLKTIRISLCLNNVADIL